MAQTKLTTQVLKQNNYSVQPGDLNVVLNAADVANGNSFAVTGQEILVVYNADVSPHTFTLTSVPDRYGRTLDIAAYSVAAGAMAAIQCSVTEGWKQADGNVYIVNTNALMKIAVVAKN
jgi:ABC-type proline/glycine betaine transport system substrate-binding protein